MQVPTPPVSGLEPLIWLWFRGGWGSVSEQASSLAVAGEGISIVRAMLQFEEGGFNLGTCCVLQCMVKPCVNWSND